jgi:hypothetical protein
MIWQLLEAVVNFNMATYGNLWQLLEVVINFDMATYGNF